MGFLMVLFWIIAVVAVLSIPLLWVVVLTRSDDNPELFRRLEQLEKKVAALQASLAGQGVAPQAPPSAAAAPPDEAEAEPPPLAVPPEAAAVALQPATPPPRAPIEDWIMRRWAVWLGGVALALGGVFLVRYSIEQGWFGPSARVTAGVLLGLLLTAASEVARRRPALATPPGLPLDYVPPALAAAGVIVLFASLYAGYALYALIPASLAFVLLAAVSLAGAALSLLHGMSLAVLGLAGAYLVPLLVRAETPSVPRLLAYVLVVTAGCLALVRWRDWPWLGCAAVAGSGAWGLAALLLGGPADEVAVGLFLLSLAALYPACVGEPGGPRRREAVAWSGAAVAALLTVLQVQHAAVDGTSLAFAWAMTALNVAIGVRWPQFDRLPWIAALLQLLVLAGWRFAPGVAPQTSFGSLLTLPPGPAIGGYLASAVAVAALAGLGGFVMLFRAPLPHRWALLSALTPLAALAIAYWRVEQLAASVPWAAAAFLLAFAFLVAAELVAARRVRRGFTGALACYALAVTAAVALALTFSLRLGWLSVALALQLPVIAWLERHLAVPALRRAALALAGVVMVRLLLNPAVAAYDLGSWPILNALLYLYGVPAAAFAVAAYALRRSGDDTAVELLKGGALALALALVSLEIRHLVSGGDIAAARYPLLEQALQTDAWLAIACVVLPAAGVAARPMRDLAWRVILAAATLHLLLMPCLAGNPLIRPESVGELPLLDVLLLAYAVPAGFALFFQRAFRARGMPVLAQIAGVMAVALAFVYVSLEVRHLFHGALLDRGSVSDAELYAYSAAWMVYGATLLAIGILRHDRSLRLAGLVLGSLVLVKAFGFDMAQLTGLYRAASFLGLGASFVGIAWLYQRVVGADASSSG